MSVVKITARFRACQGSLDLFALEGQSALDLLASNPLAGFCLAINGYFHKPAVPWPMSAARFYMTKPQREILAWLDFTPGTEAVAKIGRKCVPESLDINRCLRLRRALARDDVRHLLAHLPRVNAGVLALVTDRVSLAHLKPRVLIEVAESPVEDTHAEAAGFFGDICRMWREVRHDETLTHFSSLDGIRALHDELVTEMNRHGVRWFQGRVYPPPPLPGMATTGTSITPVTSVDELQALGRAQHNCVVSYMRRIFAGRSYIYRVTVRGHVCTLCLTKGRSDEWQVSELRAACNRPAPSVVIREVQRWLLTTPSQSDSALPTKADVITEAPSESRVFPLPPFAGTSVDGLEIVPLLNPEMLAACGAEIVYYRGPIESGRACAYRIIAPTGRAVVIVTRVRGRSWQIRELRGDGGLPVHGNTLMAVSQWLGRAQIRFG